MSILQDRHQLSKYILSSIYMFLYWALCWRHTQEGQGPHSQEWIVPSVCIPLCVHEISEMGMKTVIAKHSGKCLNQVDQSHICFLFQSLFTQRKLENVGERTS